MVKLSGTSANVPEEVKNIVIINATKLGTKRSGDFILNRQLSAMSLPHLKK